MKHVIRGSILLLGLVLVTGCVAGLASGGPDPVYAPTKAVGTPVATADGVSAAAGAPSAGAAIPPIDAAAPAQVETATFALG